MWLSKDLFYKKKETVFKKTTKGYHAYPRSANNDSWPDLALFMYSMQWTWVWANSGKWWRTGKPGVLQSMGSQRVRHDLATEQQQQPCKVRNIFTLFSGFKTKKKPKQTIEK